MKSDASIRINRFAGFLIRWRWAIIVVSLGLTVLVASGGKHLRFGGDYRVFFSADNPLRIAFEELQDSYSQNENVLFVLAPQDGEVFSRETLAAVESLTEEAWQIPFSTRVDSLSNFQHSRADGDDLIVADLVAGADALSDAELTELRTVALAEPGLVNRLVSDSGHVTAVNVQVQHEADNPERLMSAVARSREIADRIGAEYPEIDVYLSGAVMLHNAFMEATQKDLATLVPLMYLGIVVFMFLVLRSVIATLTTLLVIAMSTAVAMGAAGWLGISLTPVSAVVPTLIMTLAVADCIHILVTLLEEMRAGRDQRQAFVESLRVNVQPGAITSLTTAIGFLSLNTSDVPPVHDLGNVTAIGIVGAFLGSVVFLPALLSVLPLRVSAQVSSSPALSARLAEWVIRRRRELLAVMVAVVVGAVIFVPANEFDENTVHYFDERVPFRQHTDFVMKNLSGIHQVEYSLASESGAISDPAYLARLEDFASWWREQPEVVHVNTLSDTLKRLNRSMHGDDVAWYRVPESRELAAQYLLLYELSLPYGLDLNNQINYDRSATRFSVVLRDVSSKDIIALEERGNRWLEENAPETMQVHGVGTSIMFAHLGIRNSRSMVRGTVIAVLMISLCLVLALRSLKLGALSLIPNLVPAILGFGLWGLLVGKVGFLLSIVLAMTLGIVVDDSVHFLSKYRRARVEHGLDAADSVRHAFGSVGKALIATSLILVAGFLVLSMSSFAQNAEMGQLTAMIIILALVADFFLLPPLLMWLDKSHGEERLPARAQPEAGALSSVL